MLGRLLAALRARRRDTVLCFYGDHVPALQHVFVELDYEPLRTDYIIWRNYGDAPATRKDLSAEQLGLALGRTIEQIVRSETPARTLHATT
jgi:hypothetical protein